MRVLFNPRCTKCRILRKAFDENDVAWERVLYLEEGLERNLVAQIFDSYAGNWHDLVRTGEKVFKEAGKKLKDITRDEAIAMIVANPVLIQRPIVLKDGESIIARDDDSISCVIP